MCLADKDAGTPRASKNNAVAERLAKARMQRAMTSAVRVNLNNYWDILAPPNRFAGFARSTWRQRLANVIRESGRDQLPMGTGNIDPPTIEEEMETIPEN